MDTGILTRGQRDLLREALTRRAGVDRDARDLAEVESALSRLGEPGFGLCAQCEEPIGWERLLARPEASRCVRCQSASERSQPRPSL
jgi:RNA polymerase-binding transcription factor DksA